MHVRRLTAVCALVICACSSAGSGALDGPVSARLAPRPSTWSSDDLNITYVGHASILIGFHGTMILTDPSFFDRVGAHVGPLTIGPKRLTRPALTPDELPPLDAVVVTHAHFDSLDLPSLQRLRGTPLLVVPARTRDLVDGLGFARVVEIEWGHQVTVGTVTIEAIEVQHWGKRWPWGVWRGYNGYVFSSGDEHVLFASDTAYTAAIGRVGQRHQLAAAVIGNGAYDPWIWNHANPEQVWQMFKESGAQYLLPVHWDTFRLGREPVGDAMRRLLAAAGREANRIGFREIGETWTMPQRQD